jgi:arylsulfatase A-like enzyme
MQLACYDTSTTANLLHQTDDQDQMLGSSFPIHNGVTPMPQTQKLMAEQGQTATNMFIHTPICNPSRSELLSGRYFHNIKEVGDSSSSGNIWSMHINEPKVNNATFAKYLKEEAGYTVGMFGKYMNVMPKTVPDGFDSWMGNGGGNYIAPTFQIHNVDGIPDSKSYQFGKQNYTTAVVGNISNAWIRKVVKEDPTRPFFAYVAPKAAHEPFMPAPWYVDHWDPSWPATEPQDNPAWNCSAASRADKHGKYTQLAHHAY